MYDKTVSSVYLTEQLVHLFGKDGHYFVTVPDQTIKVTRWRNRKQNEPTIKDSYYLISDP